MRGNTYFWDTRSGVLNFVIKGSMMTIIDGHEIILNEGDSIYFDSGFNHAMKALNNEQVKFLAMVL